MKIHPQAPDDYVKIYYYFLINKQSHNRSQKNFVTSVDNNFYDLV